MDSDEWPDVNPMKFLSKFINFSLEMVIYNISNWPKVYCTKEYNVEILRSVLYGEVEISAVQSIKFQAHVSTNISILVNVRE